MDLIRILETDDWIVDYDRDSNRYRVSYFQDYHFDDECWFDAYEERAIPSVGTIVYYVNAFGESEECKVSMLQQKADKSWKVRLSPSDGSGVFDITLDSFNKHCRFVK